MNINERLYTLRKEHNMTQEDVATSLSVTRQTVSNWETGNGQPSLDKAVEIAQLYEISLDDLVGISTQNKQVSKLIQSLVNKTVTLHLKFSDYNEDDYGIEMMKREYKNVKITEVGARYIRFEHTERRQVLEKLLFLENIAFIVKGDA